MSVNSTSTPSYLQFYVCSDVEISIYIAIVFTASRTVLLLPLSTLVLYLGHQRWRQHRSSKPATHSDIITYHVAAMELIGVLGSFCFFVGSYTNHYVMIQIGLYLTTFSLSGEALFHILTCVERYLAVVHPITYMGLRNARGVKIRNICIGCVWLLSFGLAAVIFVYLSSYGTVPSLCFLVPSVIVISFCSLSVLCVLIRPGPGKASKKKQRVDQSKRRTFYTTTVISVTVWLWFVGILLSTAVNTSPVMGNVVNCLVSTSVNLLNLPSSLVSPLLYLHRAGKLSCCC